MAVKSRLRDLWCAKQELAAFYKHPHNRKTRLRSLCKTPPFSHMRVAAAALTQMHPTCTADVAAARHQVIHRSHMPRRRVSLCIRLPH
jgi:hypothetical protein